jgi:hypothetical protein
MSLIPLGAVGRRIIGLAKRQHPVLGDACVTTTGLGWEGFRHTSGQGGGYFSTSA